MKTMFEEYGYFIIALIVFVSCMVLFTWFQTEYKDVSRKFICALTGVEYDQTLYQ